MAGIPEPMTVESEGDYVHVRYRDPDQLETAGTPDWADEAAASVVEGSEVRMGKREGSGEWKPESILIPEPVDEDVARQQADEVLKRIDT
jgi:hypothetical protein